MDSYPSNELPLPDLLRFAAKNRLTASIDMRSQLTAGRIDIRDGQVIDAQLGGLSQELAVYAAISSADLRVLRGRTPKRSAPCRMVLTTEQLLRQAKCSDTQLSTRLSSNTVGSATAGTHSSTVRRVDSRSAVKANPSRLKRLRFYLFVAVGVALVALAIVTGWNLVSRGVPAVSIANFRRLAVADPVPSDLFGGGATPPRLLAAVRPKVNRDGTAPLQPVVVDVLVDETGVAFGAKLDQLRSGLVELEDAAIAAALSARFEPGTRRGHATTSWTKVLVQFEPAPGVVALSG